MSESQNIRFDVSGNVETRGTSATQQNSTEVTLLDYMRSLSFQPRMQRVLAFYLTDTHEATAILDDLCAALRASELDTMNALTAYAKANGLRVTVYRTRPELERVIVYRPAAVQPEASECAETSPPTADDSAPKAYSTGPAPEPAEPTFKLTYPAAGRVRNTLDHSARLFSVYVCGSAIHSLEEAARVHAAAMRNCGYPARISLRVNDRGIGEYVMPVGPTLLLSHAVRLWDAAQDSDHHLFVYAVPDDAHDADLIPLVQPGGTIPSFALYWRRRTLRGGEPLSVEALHELTQAVGYGTVVSA